VDKYSVEPFQRACQAPPLLRLEIEDSRTGRVEPWAVPRPYAVVGRGEGAGLILDHADVARRHAYLQIIRGRIFCVDLASRTGTRWQATPERAGWVRRDQPVGIGPFWLRSIDDQLAEGRWLGGMPDLVLEHHAEDASSGSPETPPWRMKHVMALLGRSGACNVQLTGPDVPRFLCTLLRTPSGAWLIDLEGKGLVLGGVRVACARVDDGDELRVGAHVIRFRQNNPNKPAAPLPPAEPPRALVPEIVEPGMLQLMDQLGQFPGQMPEQLGPPLMLMARAFGSMFREQMDLVRQELDEMRRLGRELEALRAELAVVAAAGQPAAPALSAPPPQQAPALAPAPVPPDARPTVDPQAQAGLNELHATLYRRLATLQEEQQSRWQKLLGTVLGRGG
jgi:hypothetical protein